MSKVPNLAYDRIINALQRDGWIVVRQKGAISVFKNAQLMKL